MARGKVSFDGDWTLMNYPQGIISATLSIFRSYSEGKAKAAHNTLVGLLNILYPIMQLDLRELMTRIKRAEAEYYHLLDSRFPKGELIGKGIGPVGANSPLRSIYETFKLDGQALFDQLRLRVLGISLRKMHIDGFDGVVEGGITVGKFEEFEKDFTNLLNSLERITGKKVSTDERERFEEMTRAIFEVKIRGDKSGKGGSGPE